MQDAEKTLREVIKLMVEQTVKEDDLEESQGSSTVGYVLPLGAKPPEIPDGGPSKKKKSKRKPAWKAASSGFGGAKLFYTK